MPTTKFLSGQLKLNALRDQCLSLQGHGNPGFMKLVHLQGAKVEEALNNQTQFNQAQFVSVPKFKDTPQLTFIAVTDPSKIPTIISDQLKKDGGGLLIFDEILFVEGKEQRTLGFGKT
jgi:hypothetical protein